MESASREIEIVVATADDTRRLGERLGRVLAIGDVLALIGPLGSGKTTFAQGLARGLEVPADRHVASPTFALVNEHPARVPFVHADFYRVERPEELRELGIEEACERATVALEWADRFPQVVPADHLRIVFETASDGARRLRLSGTGPRGQKLIAALSRG
jgi:tRNA threonylcarbamoyladenosine biosynthesis protein TsaE